jgi:hypothetical protein
MPRGPSILLDSPVPNRRPSSVILFSGISIHFLVTDSTAHRGYALEVETMADKAARSSGSAVVSVHSAMS